MSITVRHLGLEGVVEIRPLRRQDTRGFFSETWNAKQFRDAGLQLNFVQDNHSFSHERGVLRGIHYQLPPHAQDKLVRVVSGAVLDVAVDIRRGSPTFAQWVAIELSARDWNQVLVPKGFAHGFITLEPDTEVIYKTTAHYCPEFDRAIRFDDPELAIRWPIPASRLILSERDRQAPLLKHVDTFDFA